jgi:ABC-2 type transport system permease protein
VTEVVVRPTGGRLVRATVAISRMEIRTFFRDTRSLVFVLAFPVLLLVIFAALFRDTISAGGVTVPQKQLFMAGITAAGVMSTAFQGLAINIVQERESGLIRRLARTPMPKLSYFLAKVVRVFVTTLIEVVLLLAISFTLYGLPVPGSAARWLTLAWVLVLGTLACALMGMAYSAFIPSAGAAAAMTTPVFLCLQFASGVFFPLSALPGWMLNLGSVFPLRWLAQGLRAAFLPDALGRGEPGGSWQLGLVALVLGCWVVGGLVVTARTFTWRGPRVK